MLTTREPLPRMCYAPGDRWPHPPHTWHAAAYPVTPGEPVVLVAYACHGGNPYPWPVPLEGT